MRPIHFAAAATAALALAGAAQAGQVGVGAFTNPVVTGFGNPTVTPLTFQNEPGPLDIANYEFTAAGPYGLRWFDATQGYADCVGGCVTDSDGAGLDVDLGGAFALAGLYVGQAAAYNLDVSFFDTGHNLLGTVNAAGAGDGVTFAGWQSGGDKIASIQVRPVGGPNAFVVSAQSGYLQGGVPEPAAWALMITGFGLAGGMLRRRARSAAAA